MSKKNKVYVLYTLSRVYDFSRGGYGDYKWHPAYYTREQLIYKIAAKYGSEYCILKNLSTDMSEISCQREWRKSRYAFGGYTLVERNLYFLAKIKGNSISKLNVNSIIDEVIAKNTALIKKAERRSKRLKAERERFSTYEFRRGPVSDIHNYNWHRGSTYRHPKTTKSKRLNTVGYDEDVVVVYKDNKIKSLPNVYDDLVRHKDKSWKTSCKVKKQWMKHLNSHINTM